MNWKRIIKSDEFQITYYGAILNLILLFMYILLKGLEQLIKTI